MNIFANFIQKYEFYIWVYFKGETKSKNEKNLGTKNWRIFFEGIKRKVDIFILIKKYLILNYKYS